MWCAQCPDLVQLVNIHQSRGQACQDGTAGRNSSSKGELCRLGSHRSGRRVGRRVDKMALAAAPAERYSKRCYTTVQNLHCLQARTSWYSLQLHSDDPLARLPKDDLASITTVTRTPRRIRALLLDLRILALLCQTQRQTCPCACTLRPWRAGCGVAEEEVVALQVTEVHLCKRAALYLGYYMGI
eukprot:1505057-Amphidinium_carterae.1